MSDEKPASEPIQQFDEARAFYTMVFSPDPMRSRVTFFLDGDTRKRSLRTDRFISYVKGYVEPKDMIHIINKLDEFGTYWLFQREAMLVRRISAISKNDLIKIGKELTTSRLAEINELEQKTIKQMSQQELQNIFTQHIKINFGKGF